MKRLPLHPRLARMLIEAPASADVALACALLSDRHATPRHAATTRSDLLSALDERRTLPPHVHDVARRIGEIARDIPVKKLARSDDSFLRAIFTGYPDRVARRREPGSPRFLLASGHGAVLGRDSGVREADFIVAVDVHAGRRGEGSEATIRLASAIDPAWLQPTDITLEHALVDGRVRAVERTHYHAIPLAERPAAPDADEAARLLASAYRARGWRDGDVQLLRRLRFAQLPADEDAWLVTAAANARALDDIRLHDAIPWSTRNELDRLAPETLTVPSGRSTRLAYQEDGSVMASVKLQELFGLAESPRLGPGRQPVVFELLAPNGRAVQTTRDLQNFWNTTYVEVRKELRGRYPRHPWPDDPWTATATHRAKPRGSR
jgi:ATP-dependent helicase HrpB